jgi:hypothetical protein
LFAVAALAACAANTDGSKFLAEARNAAPPKSGLARVYIYPANRPDNVPIILDDHLIGEIQVGRYFSRDIPAGAHELTSANSNYPGLTRYNFTVAAGQTLYLMVEPSEGARSRAKVVGWGSVFGSVPAVLAGSVEGLRYAGKGGPVVFVPMSEAAAAPVLSELSPSQ